MRKVTRETVEAFFYGHDRYIGNSRVITVDGVSRYYLHGHNIAELDRENGDLYLSDCGWQTPTTKDRLNALLDWAGIDRIYQKRFQWYQGRDFWDGAGTYSYPQKEG